MLQAFHRHIPVLIRALGSSYSELLKIISDPPQGSENLLMLVGVIFPVILLVFLILNTVCILLFSFALFIDFLDIGDTYRFVY